jgi:DNA-binding transcriptional LysR family regulator
VTQVPGLAFFKRVPAPAKEQVMNTLINTLIKLGLLKEDLDYHLLRASMVIIFLAFGYQKRGTSEMSVILEGRVRVSAAEGVREGVFAGLGLAIASEWMFAPELKSGAVKVVLDDWLLPPHDLWAVFPGRQPTTKARVFVSYIEKQISDTAPSERPKPNRATARVATSLAASR